MSPEDVQAMIELARKSGLRRLKVGDLELEFAYPPAPSSPQSRGGRPMPSPEDLLFWSTGEPLSFERQPSPADTAKSAGVAPGKVAS